MIACIPVNIRPASHARDEVLLCTLARSKSVKTNKILDNAHSSGGLLTIRRLKFTTCYRKLCLMCAEVTPWVAVLAVIERLRGELDLNFDKIVIYLTWFVF